jgi:hypothetical protein
MSKNKAVLITDKSIVPASALDNVFKFNTFNDFKVTLYDFLKGEKITPENKMEFYKLVVDNAINNRYPTTDHLITCVQIQGINFLYVSLDNSVRSNSNGHPLNTRIDNLCKVVRNIMKSLDNKCIVFFSESCRPSFLGTREKKENVTFWLDIRNIISKTCGLNFLIEKRNNDDQSDMSFGVSAFYTDAVCQYIETYFVKSILNVGFGSAATGIKIKTGEIIWGIHFPLDFKKEGENNSAYATMVNLQNLMKEYKGSVCAIGDFNTIEGMIYQSIESAITNDFEFVLKGDLTFFGSYFDTIPYEPRTSILDQ